MTSCFSLKDQLLNPEKVRYLSYLFQAADTGFNGNGFFDAVMSRLPELGLKARIAWIAECLCTFLPTDLDVAAPILCAALPPPLDPTLSDDDFGDFIFAPFGDVVVTLGLERAPDLALDLLCDITQRFSMEWAVRPFLNRWPELTLARFADWVGHDNYHVRRLVSEGTRPKLPWGKGINLEAAVPLTLLDALYADRTRYVTRSVANHLNDMTKIKPEMVLSRLDRWRAAGQQFEKEMDWMTTHALRGMVKMGDPRAVQRVGFDPDAPITLDRLEMPASVRTGDVLPITITLQATSATGALVDYVFWRLKADGTHARSVRKMKQMKLKAGVPVTIKKGHRLKGDATTYRLLPGCHRIDIQVNGRVLGGADVDVIVG